MWKGPHHPREEWVLFRRSLVVSALIYLSFYLVIRYTAEPFAPLRPQSIEDHLFYALMNFIYMSMGPYIASAILAYFKPALAAGASLGFSIFCAGFMIWDTEGGLAWLFYLWSIPSGFFMCALLGFFARDWPPMRALIVSIIAIPATMYVNFLMLLWIL